MSVIHGTARNPRARTVPALLAATALAVTPLLGPTPAPRATSAVANAEVAVSGGPVVLVEDGDTATVTVTVRAADSTVLTEPVSVDWRTGSGTATVDADYEAGSGTLRFPAGTPSGTERTITVRTRESAAGETAETVPLALKAHGADVTAEPTVVVRAHGLPYLDERLPTEKRVADLLSRMTLKEKAGQMTQAERGNVAGDPAVVTELGLGSILSGGGSTPADNTPEGWADAIDGFQERALATRLQIPLLYGVDSVHGHGNLHGATVLPHNIGLGATRDPLLVARAGRMVATETRATGIPWTFAPCLCVVRDDRWGRTYESFGEHPALASVLGTAAVLGFQGKRLDSSRSVLATAKHFVADGDTAYGSGEGEYTIDQGVTEQSRDHVEAVDLPPYEAAVAAGVGSVMPSFSSVDWTDDGLGNPVKMHAHDELINGWLKEDHGFDGFVVSDWQGIHQIPPLAGDSPTTHQIVTSVNAGVDLFMEPSQFERFHTRLVAAVQDGEVTEARINDAVSRILAAKFELGLFEEPFADRSHADDIGSDEHRAIARKAVAMSQVLLKNDDDALPLDSGASVYVAGRNADDLGNQAGGWTGTWQGFSGDVTEGTTILEGIEAAADDVTFSEDASAPTDGADVGVVVVGETPYAEGYGDVGGPEWAWDPADGGVPREEKSMALQPGDADLVERVCAEIETCVVLVVSGRPQVLTEQLGSIDALVASWLPGTEGDGVADVLFGERRFTGRLPVSWPRSADDPVVNVGDDGYDPLFPFGWGLSTGGRASTLDRHRLELQDAVLDPVDGVPAAASKAIAMADVALLEGREARAHRILTAAR
ncbi:glycoside hydrolase family 3 N-terminal domain-containing protein [Promicromonospora iranensis]|uniref:beta-glucosidase n=1 Tax=Promicromonospora iranensis TaxID=1105144 RepID=A0ABU2CNV3_9MICO|nr:glycoside hydrolase family 3 N-terminal domain-containing protein [Promicromonospora iranensis]MDR7383024.1 beta-glucosidase [Promicromonospora iranensis]